MIQRRHARVAWSKRQADRRQRHRRGRHRSTHPGSGGANYPHEARRSRHCRTDQRGERPSESPRLTIMARARRRMFVPVSLAPRDGLSIPNDVAEAPPRPGPAGQRAGSWPPRFRQYRESAREPSDRTARCLRPAARSQPRRPTGRHRRSARRRAGRDPDGTSRRRSRVDRALRPTSRRCLPAVRVARRRCPTSSRSARAPTAWR